MTQIWQDTGTGWQLLTATPYAKEQELHDLVRETPGMLPLAGTPDLVMLGTEVRLGSGRVDLLAVESTGRPVLLEIKLQANAEARRAVVAQVLAYAAFLHGLSLAEFHELLAHELSMANAASVADIVTASIQTSNVDVPSFEHELTIALRTGGFRLVVVLDEAPDELTRLVGYLQQVAPTLIVDLVTVAAYDVGGSRVLVPQRLDPVHAGVNGVSPPAAGSVSSRAGTKVAGSTAFREAARGMSQEQQLMELADWADALASRGAARLSTYFGKRGEVTLLPYVPGLDAGLVTVWNWNGDAIVSLWRSAVVREAPDSVASLEEALGEVPLGQGNTVKASAALLAALSSAYSEAASRRRQRS